MEYIISKIGEICKNRQYNSCKEFTELLDSRLSYNLFIIKIAGIIREMIGETKMLITLMTMKSLKGLSETLNHL